MSDEKRELGDLKVISVSKDEDGGIYLTDYGADFGPTFIALKPDEVRDLVATLKEWGR